MAQNPSNSSNLEQLVSKGLTFLLPFYHMHTAHLPSPIAPVWRLVCCLLAYFVAYKSPCMSTWLYNCQCRWIFTDCILFDWPWLASPICMHVCVLWLCAVLYNRWYSYTAVSQSTRLSILSRYVAIVWHIGGLAMLFGICRCTGWAKKCKPLLI